MIRVSYFASKSWILKLVAWWIVKFGLVGVDKGRLLRLIETDVITGFLGLLRDLYNNSTSGQLDILPRYFMVNQPAQADNVPQVPQFEAFKRHLTGDFVAE